MPNLCEFMAEIKVGTIYNLLAIITSLGAAIVNFVIKIKGLSKDSYENIKKRYEIYEKIISEQNEILKYTYLRDYIGSPIDNATAEYILKSNKFYDIVTVLRNTHLYFEHNPLDGKIKFKKTCKQKQENSKNKSEKEGKLNRCAFVIGYIIFLLPALFVLIYLDKLIIYPEYLLLCAMIAIAFAIPGIFYFGNEIGNRTLAINLIRKLEKEDIKRLEDEATKNLGERVTNLEKRVESIEEKMKNSGT